MEKFLMDNILKAELWDALESARELGIIDEDSLSDMWANQEDGMRWINEPDRSS